jgi:hypothetical protein
MGGGASAARDAVALVEGVGDTANENRRRDGGLWATRRTNLGGMPVIGQIDNERPSWPTYATATREGSCAHLAANGALGRQVAPSRLRSHG